MKTLFFLLLLPLTLHARFATKPETLNVLNNLDLVMVVKADGTHKIETTLDLEILKPNELGLKQFPIIHRPSISKFSWLEGYVLQGDKKTPIEQSDITQVPPAQTVPGVDPVYSMNVNIPPMEAGAKLRLKYVIEFTKVFIPGQFAYTLNFNDFDSFIEAGSFQLISELPLHFKLNDPFHSLKVEPSTKKQHQLKVVITKPVIGQLVDESSVFLPGSQSTAISIGTTENWGEIKRNFRSLFDVVLNSTMVPEMSAVVEECRKKNDLASQLIVINGHLNSTFKDNGFMRTLNAKPILRMPQALYKMKMADNKELSAMMVMILRKLNYKADVVLVLKNFKEKYQGLPSTSFFNHVIVKVESQGETFFIDPTETPFYGTNHAYYLSGNPYLALGDDDEIEFIPYHNPIESQLIFQATYTYKKDLSASVEAEFRSSGGVAYQLLKEKSEREITNLLTPMGLADNIAVAPYILDSKIYTPLNISAKYQLKKPVEEYVTLAFPQKLQTLLADHSTWVGDLTLGEPMITKSTQNFVNLPASTDLKILCRASSRWVDFARKSILQKNALVVYEDVSIKLPYVSNKELISSEFKSFQAQLKICAETKKITLQK